MNPTFRIPTLRTTLVVLGLAAGLSSFDQTAAQTPAQALQTPAPAAYRPLSEVWSRAELYFGTKKPDGSGNPLKLVSRKWRPIMALLVTADVQGQTQEGFNAILEALKDASRPPLVSSWSRAFPPRGAGGRLEVRERAEAATAFYAPFVHPNLPPGLKPKRTLQPLKTVVSALNATRTPVGDAR